MLHQAVPLLPNLLIEPGLQQLILKQTIMAKGLILVLKRITKVLYLIEKRVKAQEYRLRKEVALELIHRLEVIQKTVRAQQEQEPLDHNAGRQLKTRLGPIVKVVQKQTQDLLLQLGVPQLQEELLLPGVQPLAEVRHQLGVQLLVEVRHQAGALPRLEEPHRQDQELVILQRKVTRPQEAAQDLQAPATAALLEQEVVRVAADLRDPLAAAAPGVAALGADLDLVPVDDKKL